MSREVPVNIIYSSKGAKQAATEAKNLRSELSNVAKGGKATAASAKETASGLGDLKAAATSAAVGLAAIKAIQIGAELVQIGASADQANMALNALSDGQADAYINAIQEASNDTISSMDAMGFAARSLRMNVVANAEEMARLTEIAKVMGQTMGIDTTYAMESLTTGLARQSKLWLDNLGILVDTEAIQADVNRMMAEDATLTKDAATQKAWLNAVLAEGETLLRQTGGVMKSQASDIETLTTGWQDLKTEISKTSAEALEPTTRRLADLVRITRDLKTAQKDFAKETAATADSFEEWAKGMAEVGLANKGVVRAMEEGGTSAAVVSKEIGELRKEYIALKLAAMEAEGVDFGQRLHNMGYAGGEAAIGIEETTEAIEEQTITVEEAEQAYQKYIDGLSKSHHAQLDLVESSSAHIAAMAELNMYYGQGYGELERNQQIGEQWLELLASTGNEYRLTGDALNEYLVAQGLASEESIRLAGAQQQVVAAMEAGKVSAEEAAAIFADVMSGQTTDVEAAVAAQQAHNEVMSQATGILDEMRGVDIGGTLQEITEPAQTVAEQFGAMSESAEQMAEMAPLAFGQLAELAPGVNEAMTPLQLSMTQIAGALTGMITTAPNWASAMNESFAALASEGSGVWQGTSLISGLYSDWLYLQQNPRLSLEAIVSITSTGGVPGAAGGAHFTADHAQAIIVGEAGRERVDVTPLTSGPHPPAISGGVPMFASGGSMTAGSSGGSSGPSIGNLNVYVTGVQNVRDLARELANGELQRALKANGLEIGRVA